MPLSSRAVRRLAVGLCLSCGLLTLPVAVAAPNPAKDATPSKAAPPAKTASPSKAASSSKAVPLPLKELRTFVQVMHDIQANYVTPVREKTLLRNAMRGMVDSLDPHSAYLDPKQFRALSVTTSGKFGGVGIRVERYKGLIRVIAPLDGTPAQKAGIKPGDLITRIGQKAVKGMNFNNAVHLLRGAPGSHVKLTVVRPGAQRELHFDLTRADISLPSVSQRLLQPGFGYLRIAEFSGETPGGVNKALKKLAKENGGPLKGLILDLRDNPGGVVTAAVAVANDFISHGVIVSMKGRTRDVNRSFRAKPGDRLHGAPMVVLINGGSASAAEILSGALHDHHRALIAGTRSFGKGSVQTIMPLGNGAAVKITTARYYTPSGRSIQGEGIEPDIIINPMQVSGGKPAFDPLKESDLSGAISNTTGSEAHVVAGDKKREAAADKLEKLAHSDYQLYEALQILRGLALAHAHMQ